MARTPRVCKPLSASALAIIYFLFDISESTRGISKQLTECQRRLADELASDAVTRHTVQVGVGLFDSEIKLGELQPVREFKVTNFDHRNGTNGFAAIRGAVGLVDKKMKEAAADGVRIPISLLCCLSDFYFGDTSDGVQELVKSVEQTRQAFNFVSVGCGDVNDSCWKSFFGKQPGVKIDQFSILPFFKLLVSHVQMASRSRPGEVVPAFDVTALQGK